MTVIFVKRKEGHEAKTSLRGTSIPIDVFIPVVKNAHIDGLIAKGAIEVRESKPARPSKKETDTVTVQPPALPASLPGGNEETK